jgi:hypothetical protein
MHCGGANASTRDRALLHFSFETEQGTRPQGFTYHILPEEEGRHCFSDFIDK